MVPSTQLARQKLENLFLETLGAPQKLGSVTLMKQQIFCGTVVATTILLFVWSDCQHYYKQN